MKSLFKIFLVLFITIFINNCGKKSGLKYPGGQKIPSFDRVFDDE